MCKSFTLIDLIVGIAMLVVLVITVFTLNPAGLLQEERDNVRIFNMSTLNSAIGYSLMHSPSESLGSANTVYVSVPDPLATSTLGDQCQGLGLPVLPLGYFWHCSASSTYLRADGTGWIPVNFSSGSWTLLPVLPVDPINTSSSQHYYTYTPRGRHYEVTSVMESAKYRLGGSGDVVSADSGIMSTLYENEKGSRIGLEPFDYSDPSLIGLWSLYKGPDSVSYDSSANNATAPWSGMLELLREVGWKDSPFDITNDSWSLNFWVNPFLSPSGATTFVHIDRSGSLSRLEVFGRGATSSLEAYKGDSYAPTQSSFQGGVWYSITEVQNGSSSTLYINGSQFGEASTVGTTNSYFSGLVDDVRIYNRALSAAEIAALYDAEK